MELSRLLRTALAALSSMVTCSLACCISMGSSPVRLLIQFGAHNFLLAHQDDFYAETLAARTAPSTSAFGASSPPIASTAMVTME